MASKKIAPAKKAVKKVVKPSVKRTTAPTPAAPARKPTAPKQAPATDPRRKPPAPKEAPPAPTPSGHEPLHPIGTPHVDPAKVMSDKAPVPLVREVPGHHKS